MVALHLPFQYPLFRIELLSFTSDHEHYVGIAFQYPLFRIELLSRQRVNQLRQPRVSISALSDRIAQLGTSAVYATLGFLFQYPLFRIELLSDRRLVRPF